MDLYETESPRNHFMGSIVNMPASSLPQDINKYLLVDGQQRLTTIFIILAILKDFAREEKNQSLADEITNTLLVNQYKSNLDHYKLMPTQIDRETFKRIIDNNTPIPDGPIKDAYMFYDKKLRNGNYNLQKIKNIIIGKLSIISIALDIDDNPYLVFESLNAKGRSLTQADLIKNYFFMQIHQDEQEDMYKKYWEPMEKAFGEKDLSEFIRHFLMLNGGLVKQTDVYYELKDKVNSNNAFDYLRDLNTYSDYYKCIKMPEEYEHNDKLKERFIRLNNIEVTTAYPVLLFFYGEFANGKLPLNEFTDVLDTLENYLIRRFICNYKTNTLNKTFASAYSAITTSNGSSYSEKFKLYLSKKGYPKDDEFSEEFKTAKLYGGGDRQSKTKFILGTIENSYGHKETVKTDNLSIEHIMPRSLSEWWQNHLGDNWEKIQENYLDTIGNLTLTGYNSELSNDNFPNKKNIYLHSHLELNKYFEKIQNWKKEQILERATSLLNDALKIWPFFGESDSNANSNVSKPYKLYAFGKTYSIKSWRDVLEKTLDTLAKLHPNKFISAAQNFSTYISTNKNKLRASRQLENGYFIEVNMSAQSILRLCNKIITSLGFSDNDWKVSYYGGLTTENNEDVTSKEEDHEEEDNAIKKQKCINRVSEHISAKLKKLNNSIYITENGNIGFYFSISKTTYIPSSNDEKSYWFTYRRNSLLKGCRKCYYVFCCGDENTIVILDEEILEDKRSEMNASQGQGQPYWHVKFIKSNNQIHWVLSKPNKHIVDITNHLLEKTHL